MRNSTQQPCRVGQDNASFHRPRQLIPLRFPFFSLDPGIRWLCRVPPCVLSDSNLLVVCLGHLHGLPSFIPPSIFVPEIALTCFKKRAPTWPLLVNAPFWNTDMGEVIFSPSPNCTILPLSA
ncbi:hypothetical protein JTE90_015467 [Oedothorax gibbosus]|uniref:Uncharacterized protein n=1 Tax=Oedothorax gibbosus TaxID=931172 RepID=A0AAV6UCI1_9ARAC|nr:hypothetical protein JTE90_015467 [Oedothorax gibbosus]